MLSSSADGSTLFALGATNYVMWVLLVRFLIGAVDVFNSGRIPVCQR